MSDKDFKVKNKLVVNGLTGGAGPLVANSNKEIDSVAFLTTLQGGTGTTTSPSSGQVLYSAGGTTYNPTTLNTLDVKGATYSADAPSSPVVGQIWVESDVDSDSFDPNIIRRKTFTATAAQTVFTTDVPFIQGYEQVFFNGMLLIRNSDYTTTSNTNVTLAAGAAAGDIVEVVSITNLNSINAATTTTNTFTGNQVINNTTGTLLSIIADNGTASEPLNIFRSNEAAGIVVKRNNGSYLNPTAILAGERTAFYIGSSTDGSTYANHAAINMFATENQTSIARGSHITFDTTNIGSVSRSEKMRIMPNGKVTIGTSSIFTTTTPTTAKLTVISDSNLNDTDTNSFISLRNKNFTNANTIVGGILSDTYRDVADPHYSAGIWFIREPFSGNASSSGSIVFGTGSNVSSLALPTERMRIDSNGKLAINGTGINLEPARFEMRPMTDGRSFMHKEVHALNIPNASPVELTRLTSTGANGYRAYFKIIFTGHCASTGNFTIIREYYWDGGTSAPVQISTYTQGSVPTISFNNGTSNVCIVNIASANGNNSKGTAMIEWLIPTDFADSVGVIS